MKNNAITLIPTLFSALFLSLFSTLFISSSVLAATTKTQVLNEAEYHIISKQTKKLDLAKHLNVPTHLEQKLQSLPTAEQTIMARAKAIKLMAETDPSNEQLAWMKTQVLSEKSLSIANIDHPQQFITIANIAQQAKSTQKIWQIKSQSKAMEQQWQAHNWLWSDFFTTSTTAEKANKKQQYASLSLALQQTTNSTALWLTEQILLEENLTKASNQLLALLINRQVLSHNNITQSENIERLSTQLWLRAADEFSYQQLQKTSKTLPKESAIAQLILANNNPELSSQAIIQLVKNHQGNEQVQSYLIKQLHNKEKQWHVAAAMAFADQNTLITQVNNLAQHSTSPALTFALSQMAKE